MSKLIPCIHGKPTTRCDPCNRRHNAERERNKRAAQKKRLQLLAASRTELDLARELQIAHAALEAETTSNARARAALGQILIYCQANVVVASCAIVPLVLAADRA